MVEKRELGMHMKVRMSSPRKTPRPAGSRVLVRAAFLGVVVCDETPRCWQSLLLDATAGVVCCVYCIC